MTERIIASLVSAYMLVIFVLGVLYGESALCLGFAPVLLIIPLWIFVEIKHWIEKA